MGLATDQLRLQPDPCFDGREGMSPVRQRAALALLLLLFCSPSSILAASPPQRVVSLNLCTDQLLLMLLPRERIAMLSQLAADPALSWEAAKADDIARFDGSVEAIIGLSPDLILAGTQASRETNLVLQRLGFPVQVLEMPETVAGSLAFIERVAGLIGEPAAGRVLAERTRQRLEAVRITSRAHPPGLALIYLPNGLSPGANTLRDELLTIAGWRNLTRERDITGYASIALEDLLLNRPQMVFLDTADLEHTSMSQQLLHHPALREHIATRAIPTSTWMCAGPQIADAAELLSKR